MAIWGDRQKKNHQPQFTARLLFFASQKDIRLSGAAHRLFNYSRATSLVKGPIDPYQNGVH